MNEDIKNELMKIMQAFPHSYIKCFYMGGFELILDKKHIFHISLNNLQTSEELKRRFISGVSRCYKTEPFVHKKRNEEYQEKLIKQFNQALKTKFTRDEIQFIYTYLGNGCNRNMADEFVASHFDIEVLKDLVNRKETQKYE